MKSIETSGKTVEDAIKAGLSQLNCDLADVNIDVMEAGSPGLFGMFGKLARVRVTVKDDDSDFDLSMPVMSLDVQEEKKPQPREKKPQQKPQEKPAPKPSAPPSLVQKPEPEKAPVPKPEPEKKAPPREAREPCEARETREPREARETREPREAREERPRRQPRPEREHDATPVEVSIEDLPELDLASLSEVGKDAYEFLSNVTKLMGVDVEIRLRESEGHLEGQMIGDALGVLIGRRGDTLDALQYLTSLRVNKGREGYVRVTLDTEHYRAKRVDALTKLANRMASRVRKTGHRVALEPMNPYERRVLHSALQGHPYVTTHSEGEEPYRRVIITLK